MYTTTLTRLLESARYFETHPDGLIKTGMWTDPTWTRADWRRWFLDCLHAKINRTDTRTGRKLSDEYDRDLAHDARLIRSWYADRVRCSGRNVLRTPELKRRYPEIDNPPPEV